MITFLFYVPGLILFNFLPESYLLQYKYTGQPYTSFFIMGSFFSVSLIFLSVLFDKINLTTNVYFPTQLVYIATKLLILIYFICSIIFFINYDASFRHTSRLSEAGMAVKIIFFLQPLIFIYILFALVHILNGNKLGRESRNLIILFLIGMLLSLNSSLSLIAIFSISALIFKPDLLKTPLKDINFKRIFLILIIIFIAIVGVIFVGLGNKVGFEYLLTKDGLDFIYYSVGNIVARVSSSLMSNATLFDCCSTSIDISVSTVEGIYTTFMNRLSLVIPLGGDFNNNIIETVNRSNYLIVFKGELARAGASPGVLATIFYIPIFPFGFIILPLFYVFLSKVIASKLSNNCHYNLLSLAILPLFILPLFEAPLNILYIIDPVFISFIFFISIVFIDVDKLYIK